jgi:hypothetical protein
MNSPAAFRAGYADWKLVKTRAVVQIVFEVPLEDSDAAYEILGGMPNHANERWFGIAALTPPATESVIDQPTAKTRERWSDCAPSKQAGITRLGRPLTPRPDARRWSAARAIARAAAQRFGRRPASSTTSFPVHSMATNSLENCQVLCTTCDDIKTDKKDIPTIAKAKRISDKHQGVKIKSRGFQRRPPQRTASRPIVRRIEA